MRISQIARKGLQGLKKIFSGLSAFQYSHPVWFIFSAAGILELLTEMLSRRSVWKAFVFLAMNPLMFVCNMVLIMFTLSFSLFTRKRKFVFWLVSLVWLGLGIANCVVLGYRTTPVAAIDILLLPAVFGITKVYLTVWQIALIIAGAVLAVLVLILLCIKEKSKKIRLRTGLCLTTVTAVLSVAICFFTVKAGLIPSTAFSDLAKAYGDYGFAYCFSVSLADRGIDKPVDYSQDTVEQILARSAGSDAVPEKTPNLIFVQLESFFDADYIEGVSFSQTPTPNFNRLKKYFPSGFLTVPSIGAGTANTEFEVLTGMSLDYFGVGEFPYTTVLQNKVCESVCFDLKDLGYTAHALHNHSGDFYDRNLVYANLGFDTFTSIEYMNDVEYNPIGWAKDSILTGEIEKILNSTPGKDLVFTISVQGHGKYPTDPQSYDSAIKVTGVDNPAICTALEYYADQIHGTDAFVGDLVQALADYDEETIVVFYGDHLPGFSDFGNDNVENGNAFQTEYVIWSNFPLQQEDELPQREDLEAYQLSACVLQKIGIDSGALTKLHQNYSFSPFYQSALEMLEYDMLYGEGNVYGGMENMPYCATDLQMGTEPILIDSVEVQSDHIFVTGKNFTKWSHVRINGGTQETVFINPNTLMLELDSLAENSEITVSQIGAEGTVLSTCNQYIYWTE